MKTICALCLTVFLTASCRKDDKANGEAYDIILVIGQSNTHFGYGYHAELDAPSELVLQLGRFDSNDYRIIPAAEPLDHHTKKINRIGFALTFAKLYAGAYLEDNRRVLIIPGGRSGSGFKNNKWNKGDALYTDAVERTLFVLRSNPASRIVAILWQQGEDDIQNPFYESDLDEFIACIRKDLGANDVPFILGGMVPGWVDQLPARGIIQDIIEDTPNRVARTGYANPVWPSLIPANTGVDGMIHYNAEGLREMAVRYFTVYTQLR